MSVTQKTVFDDHRNKNCEEQGKFTIIYTNIKYYYILYTNL